MYFVFLWEVMKRAFTPAPRVTDMLQILAASTLPAVTKFLGLRMPESANNDALAYIGLVALSFVVIRLLWAPYAMWKEQSEVAGRLKIELSKPERMILEGLARHRAKARVKLAGLLENFQTLSFAEEWNQWCVDQASIKMTKIRRIEAEAGLCRAYDDLRGRLLVIVQREGARKNADIALARDSAKFLKLLQSYLIGEITGEDLALKLPPYTALERQP